jgi:hypothetical protein
MQIDLSAAEHAELIRLLDAALGDTRVEVRRTSTPEFHDRLLVEEGVLKAILAKLRDAKG